MDTKYEYKVCTRCLTFNHAPYIEDTLSGFSNQETTFPVIHCIVDDASTDGEQEVVKKYVNENFCIDGLSEETDDYVMLFIRHKTNINCYFAVYFLKYNHWRVPELKKRKEEYFERWAEKAKYTALCEGDDYWIDPGKLQKQVELMERNPDVSMVHTDCNVLYQETGFITNSVNSPLINYYDTTDVNYTIENLLLAKCKVRTATVLYRRDSYKAFTKQNEFAFNSGYFLMRDIQTWIGLMQQGRGIYLPEATAVYRMSVGSASRPKSYYDNIRFQLSSKELRIYYNQHYGYLQNVIADIISEYVQLLRIYREHDSSFKGILEVDKLYNCKLDHYLFKIKNAWWHVRYDLHRVKTYLKNVDDKLNL